MARITVYLSGSIAAYKGVEVVRGLQKAGHEVRVVMTTAATSSRHRMILKMTGCCFRIFAPFDYRI